MPARSSTPAVPFVASRRNPRSASRFAGKTIARLSRLATDTNTVPLVGRPAPVATSAFASAIPGSRVDPHDLAGRLHLRPEDGVDAGEPAERQDRGLHRGVRQMPVAMRVGRQHAVGARDPRGCRPASTSVAIRASETPIAFDTNGTVREARGFASRTQNRSSLTASWRFSSPRTPSRRASRRVMSSISSSSSSREGGRRDHARRVARVHARLLDVLHHGADEDIGAVAHRVDVDLDRALEEPVDEDGMVGRGLGCASARTSPDHRRRRRSPSPARPGRRTGGRRPG